VCLQLIVFTGLPGVGKSSPAEAVARQLGIPVFAKDGLEATLIRCEWDEERLILDAVHPLEGNIAAARRYLHLDSIDSNQPNAI